MNPDARVALLLLPPLDDSMPPDVREAVVRRRLCATTGRCPCGATASFGDSIAPNVHRVVFEHDGDCPAVDDRLLEVARRWGNER